MTSYKKLYENLLTQIKESNKDIKSDYNCPICNSNLLESNSELYCSNESCKFDKTIVDLIDFYATYNNLERID